MALINRPRTKGGNAHSGSSIHQKDNRNKVNTAHSLSAQQPTWKNKACKYFVSKLKFKSSLFRVSFSVTEDRTAHEAAECKQRKELNGGNVFHTTWIYLTYRHLLYSVLYLSYAYQRQSCQNTVCFLFFPHTFSVLKWFHSFQILYYD